VRAKGTLVRGEGRKPTSSTLLWGTLGRREAVVGGEGRTPIPGTLFGGTLGHREAVTARVCLRHGTTEGVCQRIIG